MNKSKITLHVLDPLSVNDWLKLTHTHRMNPIVYLTIDIHGVLIGNNADSSSLVFPSTRPRDENYSFPFTPYVASKQTGEIPQIETLGEKSHTAACKS